MSTFDKSQLPTKVLLSGADCFHLVLDKHAKKHSTGGNVMRKVFYFNSTLSTEKIDGILKKSPLIYWLCNIVLVRPYFFRLPYWKFTNKGNEIILQTHYCKIENEIPEKIILRDINIKAERFIEADIIIYPSGKSAFVLSWNHILLDAKGTTLLFEHLNDLAANKQPDYNLFFPAKQRSTSFIQYISNMYKIKNFMAQSAKPPVRSVYTPAINNTYGRTYCKTISFTSDETQRISDNAIKSGSRFGPTLFFVACCSQAVHQLTKKQNKLGDLWLPVPYDGRLRGANGPIISNSVSFIFHRLPTSALESVSETVKYLSLQMASQIKDGIPKRYTLFLNMMRHIPLWLYYFLINKTGKGVFASFLYTSTGDNFNNLASLFNEPVKEINMIPALTFPPGLTFVFLKHSDVLHLNITYSKKTIDDNELNLIEQKIKQILLTADS